ncbi:MAG TPA: 5'-nucleotidase C-terminal domain-containing protein [Egicoccus sp.]|nr:5'-nucleotidase C-terminal domain-containing protein [Egicoccus sp.]HSK24335.1 5'-nucleotidase C-terminal domain-containing protein [Egicoccus sp.]
MRTPPARSLFGGRPDRLRTSLSGLVAAIMLLTLMPLASVAQEAGFSDVDDDNVHRAAIEALAAMEILEGYPDNTFRPGTSINRAQLAAVIARAMDLDPVTPAGFSDTDGNTHEGAIGALVQAGVITGYADGTFRPGEPIRREHTATIITRWLGLSPAETGPFSDVAGFHAGNVHVLERVDVIEGRTADTFAPMSPVTRAQTASLVHRALDIADLEALRLVTTNDFHGRITNAPYLATQLNAIKEAYPNTLHVDAGDLVGATPVLSNLFYDEPTVEVMNAMGLAIQSVGNHEFDRGRVELERRADGGCFEADCGYRGDADFLGQDYSTLSANVVDEATDAPLTDPYEIVTMGGIDVGFIGVVTEDTPNIVKPDGVEGLDFRPEAETVNEWLPVVQDAGADLVVVLMHEGGRQLGGANGCTDFTGAADPIIDAFDEGVDIVVTGHTHEAYVCDLEDGPLVTSASQYGEMFTEITLLLDDAGEIVHRMADNREIDDTVTPDPDVLEIVEHYQELAGPTIAAVVGTSDVAVPRTTRAAESAQGNFATDALRDQLDDIDFAFQNSGGLRADLTLEDQRDGDLYEITRGQVLEVWPFGNTVAVAEIDGETLEAILANGVREIGGGRFIQVSGLRIEYSIDESVATDDNNGFPRGVIESVEYFGHGVEEDGTPVDLTAAATYRIAMNDFMAVGGDGYPNIQDDVVLLGDPIENYIIGYLEQNAPVSPMVEGRIVEID